MSSIDHDQFGSTAPGHNHFDLDEATVDVDHASYVTEEVPVEEVETVAPAKKKFNAKTGMVAIGAVLAVVATGVVVFGGKSTSPQMGKPAQMAAPNSALPPAPVAVMPATGVPEPLPAPMAATAPAASAPVVAVAPIAPVAMAPVTPQMPVVMPTASSGAAAMPDVAPVPPMAVAVAAPVRTATTTTTSVSDSKLDARVGAIENRLQRIADKVDLIASESRNADDRRQAAAQQARRPAAESRSFKAAHTRHAVKVEAAEPVVVAVPVPVIAPSLVVVGAASRGETGAVPVLVTVQGVKRKVVEGDLIDGLGRVQQTGLQDGSAYVMVNGRTYR